MTFYFGEREIYNIPKRFKSDNCTNIKDFIEKYYCEFLLHIEFLLYFELFTKDWVRQKKENTIVGLNKKNYIITPLFLIQLIDCYRYFGFNNETTLMFIFGLFSRISVRQIYFKDIDSTFFTIEKGSWKIFEKDGFYRIFDLDKQEYIF